MATARRKSVHDAPESVLGLACEQAEALKPATRTVYRTAVRDFVKYAGRDPKDWTAKALMRWRDQLLAEGRLDAATVHLKMHGIRYAARRAGLSFADEITLLPPMPGRKYIRVLTEAQIQAILATCKHRPIDLRDRAIILLLVREGLSRTQIAMLNIRDVSSGPEYFLRSRSGKQYRATPKEDTREAVNAWVKWLSRNGFKDGRLFRALLGRPHTDGGVNVTADMNSYTAFHVVLHRAKDAGIKGVKPRTLHQTYAATAAVAARKLDT